MKKCLSVLLTAAIMICILFAVPAAADAQTSGVSEQMNCIPLASGESMPTHHRYEMGVFGHISDSYLVQNADSTLTRIEHYYEGGEHNYSMALDPEASGSNYIYYDPYEGVPQKILVDTYSSDGKTLLNKRYIPMELLRFGGFYSGSKYNFFFFCQDNTAKKDNVEVIRVVRYSKEWKRLGAASLRGADTKHPVQAGNLSVAEYGGKLYVHTCRVQYSGHQANLMFTVNEEKDTITENSASSYTGYVSHSFNQFIQISGGYVYRVDHGDSYPTRAISISRASVSSSLSDLTTVDVIDLSKTGRKGENYTGAEIGGFEMTKNGCLMAGTIVNYKNYDVKPDDTKNLFICTTDKNLKNVKVKMLTSFTSAGGISASNPHLVKINDNKFLLIWGETDSEMYNVHKTRFAEISADGTLLTPIYSNAFATSDCKPVLCRDGIVRWYAGAFLNCYDDTGTRSYLYSMDPSDLAASDGIDSMYASAEACGFSGDYFWALSGGVLTITDENGDFVTDIPDSMFIYCDTLKKVTLADGMEKVGESAFSYCTELTEMTFPDSVTEIASGAFSDCSDLKKVTFGSGLKTIDSFAFLNCPSLHSVTIPAGVTDIGWQTFGYYFDWDAMQEKKVGDFTITGYEGTAAQRYAQMNGFRFVSLGTLAILGDADNDGEVTIIDATTIQRHIAELPTESFNERAADADKDGEVTILDATVIQRHIAELAIYEDLGKPV